MFGCDLGLLLEKVPADTGRWCWKEGVSLAHGTSVKVGRDEDRSWHLGLTPGTGDVRRCCRDR